MRNPAISRREPPVTPRGEGRSAWRATLEAGAALLQDTAPLKDFDIYVAGLHCAGHEPEMQMEAHHFCRQINHWHPHNYEVLSGQLCAPGLPEVAERASLEELMNSYGKTWHTWHTGRHDGEPADALPLGEPKLMWSFKRDGEADERLKADFQRHMGVDEADKREQRQGFVALAHPQRGVDTMAAEFSGTTPIPGVVEAGS